VLDATPPTRPVAILSRAFDVTGRPVAYLLADRSDAPPDGADVPVPAALLRRTLNASQLAGSFAYLTLYDTTPAAHRRALRAIARRAREEDRGVWQADSTGSFSVATQAALGPDGDLILPKLFRRATDYIADRDDGFEGTLVAWLRQAMVESGPEDDEVLVAGGRTRLSDLLTQRGSRVRFDPDADLLDLVFVAKCPRLSRARSSRGARPPGSPAAEPPAPGRSSCP
jgi:hypothetical protein